MQGMQNIKSMRDLLAGHPFMADIEPEWFQFFYQCGTIRRFGSGQHIFYAGGVADHLYLVLSGRVALEAKVPGRGQVAIDAVSEGGALGWSWLFPPHHWRLTATTTQPTEVISLDANALRDKARADKEFRSDLLMRVTRTLVRRLEASQLRLVELSARGFSDERPAAKDRGESANHGEAIPARTCASGGAGRGVGRKLKAA